MGVSPEAAEDPDCDPSDASILQHVDHSLFEDTIWPAMYERVPAFEELKVDIHSINTPFEQPVNTLTPHPINTPYQHTLSIKPINIPYYYHLTNYSINTTYQHPLNTSSQYTPQQIPPTSSQHILSIHTSTNTINTPSRLILSINTHLNKYHQHTHQHILSIHTSTNTTNTPINTSSQYTPQQIPSTHPLNTSSQYTPQQILIPSTHPSTHPLNRSWVVGVDITISTLWTRTLSSAFIPSYGTWCWSTDSVVTD